MTDINKKLQIYFFSIIFIFILPSCSKLFMGIMGLKLPKEQTTEQIIKYSKKFNIPLEKSFIIDTLYIDDMKTISVKDTLMANNLMQPLQMRFYNKTDTLLSIHINCSTSGFPNLKWNKYGQFDTIPPKYSVQLDTVLLFQNDLKYVKTLNGNIINKFQYNNADFNILLYWSIFMNRQSKILISEAQDFVKRLPDKKINIIYINTDPLFSHSEVEF